MLFCLDTIQKTEPQQNVTSWLRPCIWNESCSNELCGNYYDRNRFVSPEHPTLRCSNFSMTDHGYTKEILALSIGPLYTFISKAEIFNFRNSTKKPSCLLRFPVPIYVACIILPWHFTSLKFRWFNKSISLINKQALRFKFLSLLRTKRVMFYELFIVSVTL